jgi:hypothetical protein
MSFAFQASGRAEQDAQSVLLHRPEPGPRLRQMQASLGTGDCIMLDRDGRIAPVHWDLMAVWIQDALSTDAADDTADDTADDAAGGEADDGTEAAFTDAAPADVVASDAAHTATRDSGDEQAVSPSMLANAGTTHHATDVPEVDSTVDVAGDTVGGGESDTDRDAADGAAPGLSARGSSEAGQGGGPTAVPAGPRNLDQHDHGVGGDRS